MQIKKQEIEDALIRTAEEEFYKYGFRNASVRRILTKTGVSIGSFYNYFQNKEALYEKVVGSEYRRFLSMMTEHEHHEHNGSYEGRLSDVIARVIPDFSRRFVILIEGSEGTRFDEARERMARLAKEHLKNHMDDSGVCIQNELLDLLANQFLDGLLAVVKAEPENTARRNRLLADYVFFYFSGMMGLINEKKQYD